MNTNVLNRDEKTNMDMKLHLYMNLGSANYKQATQRQSTLCIQNIYMYILTHKMFI